MVFVHPLLNASKGYFKKDKKRVRNLIFIKKYHVNRFIMTDMITLISKQFNADLKISTSMC